MDQKMNEANEPKILICSVGSSPEPIIKTIEKHEPDYVIYIASKESREGIGEINQLTTWKGIKDSEILMISDHENLNTCVLEMRAGLQRFLELKDISPDIRIYADITGGTKPMSSALSLVMMEYNSLFSYIGGHQRNPNDRMIVVRGQEKFILMDNPWETLGIREARILVDAFNVSQFPIALKQAKFLEEKRTDGVSQFYEGLGLIIEGFEFWDLFDYKKASRKIKDGMKLLKGFNTSQYPKFQRLFRQLENTQPLLTKLESEAEILQKDPPKLPYAENLGRTVLEDLVANAMRRAEDGHYDDAVARLYSAIEKTAKLALGKLGKNNSKLSMKDLEQGGQEFVEKYSGEIQMNGHAKIPLENSWKYLTAIAPDNPAVITWLENEAAIKEIQSSRNFSLLAHGFTPVKKQSYEDFLKITLDVLGIEKDKLIKFPKLTREEILI